MLHPLLSPLRGEGRRGGGGPLAAVALRGTWRLLCTSLGLWCGGCALMAQLRRTTSTSDPYLSHLIGEPLALLLSSAAT